MLPVVVVENQNFVPPAWRLLIHMISVWLRASDSSDVCDLRAVRHNIVNATASGSMRIYVCIVISLSRCFTFSMEGFVKLETLTAVTFNCTPPCTDVTPSVSTTKYSIQHKNIRRKAQLPSGPQRAGHMLQEQKQIAWEGDELTEVWTSCARSGFTLYG